MPSNTIEFRWENNNMNFVDKIQNVIDRIMENENESNEPKAMSYIEKDVDIAAEEPREESNDGTDDVFFDCE